MLRVVTDSKNGDAWARSDQRQTYSDTTYVTTGELFRKCAANVSTNRKKVSELTRALLDDLLDQRALPPIPAEALVHPKRHKAHVANHGAMPAELGIGAPNSADFTLSPETRLIGVVGHDMVLDDVWSMAQAGVTRILAAWHQSACRDAFDPLVSGDVDAAHEKAQQVYLPFGTEILAPQINVCLAQQRFDLALGYRPDDVLGGRVCTGNSMNMLRSVAGSAPGTAHAKSTRILLANLPEQSESIAGRNDSCRFAALAITRMAAIADRIWDINASHSDMRGGYAMDIHLPAALMSAEQASQEILGDVIDALNTRRDRRAAPLLRVSIHDPDSAGSDEHLFPFTVDLREARAKT